MALFAMLAAFTSPALAFACCCLHDTGAVVAAAPKAPSHPGCHGHSDEAPHAVQSQAASSGDSIAFPAAAPLDGPCVKSICECPHAAPEVAVLVDTHQSSVFSPLVLGTPVQAFAFQAANLASHRFAFASSASRPRSPNAAYHTGRAPPAFSLLS